jgi:hypothetical protein
MAKNLAGYFQKKIDHMNEHQENKEKVLLETKYMIRAILK